MKHGYLVLLMGLLFACASDPPKPTASGGTAAATEPESTTGVICRKEAPSGSIVRKKVCTTPEEREANRRRAEMDADSLR